MTEIEYINLRALSKRLGIAPRTVRNWISDPNLKLPAYRVKGLLLFNWAEVERWVEGYRVKAIDIDVTVDELLTDFTKGKKDESK